MDIFILFVVLVAVAWGLYFVVRFVVEMFKLL